MRIAPRTPKPGSTWVSREIAVEVGEDEEVGVPVAFAEEEGDKVDVTLVGMTVVTAKVLPAAVEVKVEVTLLAKTVNEGVEEEFDATDEDWA